MNIPELEQQDVLDSFWTMLRECETAAENSNDVLLKHWVGQWYEQYSRIVGLTYKPSWVNKSDVGSDEAGQEDDFSDVFEQCIIAGEVAR